MQNNWGGVQVMDIQIHTVPYRPWDGVEGWLDPPSEETPLDPFILGSLDPSLDGWTPFRIAD